MILREGNPIGIVEVVFTHECSDEKWSRLGGWGNTAVEVTTEEILGNSDYARWVPARPLPLVRGLNLPRGTICDDCIERDLAAKREAAARTREEERRWNTPMRIVLAVCFVDLLFKDGRRRAQRLVLSRVRRRGAWESARLVDQDGRVLSSWEAPVASDQDLLATAKETARLWIQPLKEKHARIETNGGFRSVPDDNELEQMELCAAEDQEAVVVKMKFFPRLWWSPQTTHWVRCYSYRETAEKLGIETHTFYKWRDSAKIRFIEVQHHRGSKAVRLPDADGVDGFASWLDRRRAERGESRHRPEPASLPSDDRFLLPAQIESTRSPPSAQAAEQSIDPIGVRGRAQER
jgi:hypothetical protein